MEDYAIVSDYHVHSTFSVDGKDDIEAMAWRALSLGFSELAVTEHAEWHAKWRGAFDVNGYFAELERCRSLFTPLGLILLSGVEMGNPHEFSRPANKLLDAYPFQVRLASLHWLYDENIHDAACFAGRDPDDVYADYFSALGQMAADFGRIEGIAHFDRILWRGSLLGARFDPRRIEHVVRDALLTVAWRGLALELNTRLLDHTPGWRETLVTLLTWFREEGGRSVIVNSDAHRAQEMGRNLDLARSILDEAGLAAARLRTDAAFSPAMLAVE